MKSVFPACLLLLWTLTAPVSYANEIAATEAPSKPPILLDCSVDNPAKSLEYKDETSREYDCDKGAKIFVKFRTCDNCIELDTGSITGMAVGTVVATTVIGVAVYLIASQTRSGPVASHKKSSDRQHLVTNEGSRAPNDHYQQLKPHQKATYDVLNTK